MQQHLKDHIFHRVCKHIRDSIRYLYSNPRTTYSQLMITTHKVESKAKEAHDKVRARSAVTTEPVKGTMGLGNQIAKLTVTLTTAGQGNTPPVPQTAPDREAVGEDGWTAWSPKLPQWATGLGQTATACSIYDSHGTGTTSQVQGQNAQGSKDSQGNTSNRKDPISLQCFRCQG